MIKFISFSFSGDKFYQQKTTIPLGTPGLTLFRGTNYDAVAKDDHDPMNTPSNGTGKTRLGQILEGFIYGKTARGPFKKMVTPAFQGTLEFEDLRTKTLWSFSLTEGDWEVKKNGSVLEAISHKSSDVQGFLQQTIGISREEWSYFVQIDGDSLRTLIKGKPAERRAYLEEFFNIDAYYLQQLENYKQKVRDVEQDIRLVEQDQVRLLEVESALEKLPGSVWLERQVEFSREISQFLQTQQDTYTKEAEKLRNQVHTWSEYHKLLVKYEDFDLLKEEEKQKLEESQLQELRVKVEQQHKLRLFVTRQLTPHKSRQPKNLAEKPEFSEPTPQSLAEKKHLLAQMNDKMVVKQTLRDLLGKLPELPEGVTVESVESERLKLQGERVEWEHRLAILEKTHGKGECPTCGQDLPEQIKTESPEKAKAKIAALKAEMLRLNALLLSLKDHAKKEQEIAFQKKRLDEFPVFGLTLPQVKSELETLEKESLAWNLYRKRLDEHQEWLTRDKELEAEARALGYPSLLEEKFEVAVQALSQSVKERALALKEAAELKRLIDLVMALPPLRELEARLQELQAEILPELKTKIEETAQIRGTYTFQLKQRRELLESREDLKKRVEPYEALKKLSRKLEVAADFYSPSGFKLYELKQRCRLLVERANYWSQIFFQEPYQWSLSEDLDDLNLFVTPTNLKKEDPYPVALLSAGERNRAARVLLFAQLELIPPTKKTNLLFLDEIEANLDEAGMKAFTDVAIPKLKETFPDRSIVIVSHLKGLKNSGHLDHLWLAERRERKTKLTPYPWYHRKLSVGEACAK